MDTTTITTDTNLDSLNLPVSQRAEIEPGCVVYRWQHLGTPRVLTVWPETARAAWAANGDSVWGEWDGEALMPDEGRNRIVPGREPLCCYEGCEREATDHDCDGDSACELHAAQSESWIVLADLTESGTWLTAEQAARVEELLEEGGWDVTIRSPRRGEAEGTYYQKRDGTLQIVGYSIPQPAAVRDAIEDAANAVV